MSPINAQPIGRTSVTAKVLVSLAAERVCNWRMPVRSGIDHEIPASESGCSHAAVATKEGLDLARSPRVSARGQPASYAGGDLGGRSGPSALNASTVGTTAAKTASVTLATGSTTGAPMMAAAEQHEAQALHLCLLACANLEPPPAPDETTASGNSAAPRLCTLVPFASSGKCSERAFR